MRILLVEDDVSFSKTLEKSLLTIPNCEIDTVTSQHDAIARLEADFYDLIILDREIAPSGDRALEASKEHGWSLFLYIEANSPGIPVRFLSGYWDTGLASDLMNYARPSRACGIGKTVPHYQGQEKIKVHLLRKEIEEMAQRIGSIDGIPVTIEKRNSPARPEEERVLRIFANLRGGVSVRAVPFTDGLSGASVHKVELLNAYGVPIDVCVAKIGPSKEIQTEQIKHRDYFTKLKGHCVPNGTEVIDAGAGAWSGAFYSIAGADTRTLFETVETDVDVACAIVVGIEAAQEPWINSAINFNRSVRQIRQRYIGNSKFQGIEKYTEQLNMEDGEAITVASRECIQHRDLHGANILVGDGGGFHIIDYAEAQNECACADGIMLELSVLFHKDSTPLREKWPSAKNLENWCDLDLYLENCPFPSFIRACREWALRNSGSSEELWATAYAIALRQLQYSDVVKENAISVAECCLNQLIASAGVEG